jgi:hypothetical protein
MIFFLLTFTNEVLDLPHFILGDKATTWSQRGGEICIEVFIFLLVVVFEISLFKKLVNRIKILEGFLPICANCKKIRNQEDQWQQIEKYISDHTLVTFSHSVCPECLRKYYPEYISEHDLKKK